MEQVDIDQVQTSVKNTQTKYGDMWQVEKQGTNLITTKPDI